MELDHIAISGQTLAAATAYVEQVLGVPLQPGGQHERFQTHNTLLGLEDSLYLEALSTIPDAPPMDQPRMFGIDKFTGTPRLTNWICRCPDIEAMLAVLPDGFGTAMTITRGDFRWRMAVPVAGYLPYDNCAPALIEWLGDLHPTHRLAASGCRLKTLRVSHPQADELQGLLAPHIEDRRIVFETGAAGLSAAFDTPKGPVSF